MVFLPDCVVGTIEEADVAQRVFERFFTHDDDRCRYASGDMESGESVVASCKFFYC